MFLPSQRKYTLFLCVAVIINLFGLAATFAFKHIHQIKIFTSNHDTLSEETLDQDDRRQLMTVEDTSKYGIYGAQADSEWISTTPSNNGFVRIGEEHRYMLTAFGHQIHCVRVLRMAVVNPAHPEATSFHLSHCLSYLRMYALCNADLTLEKHDPLQRNFTSETHGAVHVCRDWKFVYDELRRNKDAWITGLMSGDILQA